MGLDQLSLFTAALGLQPPWEVVDVRFEPARGRIDFDVAFARGAQFACPQCGADEQPVHDTCERTWRHLNFFQFQAYIHAKVPRVRCGACHNTTQVPVPWARPNSGFTLLMEALLVTLCKAMPVRQVAMLHQRARRGGQLADPSRQGEGQRLRNHPASDHHCVPGCRSAYPSPGITL
jgi:transposase